MSRHSTPPRAPGTASLRAGLRRHLTHSLGSRALRDRAQREVKQPHLPSPRSEGSRQTLGPARSRQGLGQHAGRTPGGDTAPGPRAGPHSYFHLAL